MNVLLITGASRGIGAATARLAASRGYAVAVKYRANRQAADRVVVDIEQDGGTAVALGADVTREEEIVRLFEAVERELGPVTALVNNAGIVDQQMRVEEMTLERLERMFATNVFGAILCAREAVRRMSTRHGGRGGAIVNVSSAAARLGSPGEYVDYAASKGAIDTFTIGLAKEVAAEGIRVNGVRPGIIDTESHAAGGEPGRIERIAPTLPLQRAGTVDEVAAAILWLLSDEASYITGTLLDIAGGR
ncbi:MAG: short chain dehydrogenase [Planctomycetota bacterium]|nr:MAG: short chain dehydrogenase [Planctomycetota bacterium]